MKLVGQYDSPFVRRVGISLRVLGFEYEHDTRSIFGDFEAMRALNPLARIPFLVRDDGNVLVDSAAILDWLDQQVGSERALVPRDGAARTRALQVMALACGAIEKIGAACYERVVRPSQYRWPEWIARCRTQGMGAVELLAQETWPAKLDQAQITTACMVRHIRLVDPELMPDGRYPALDELSARCEAMPEFRSTYPADYSVPHGD
jgi:glutathione S-transferase